LWEIDVGGLGGVHDIVCLQSSIHEVQRQVTHALAAGCDLDNIAQYFVNIAVAVQHFFPAIAQAHGVALHEQVAVLASWDLVIVHTSSSALHACHVAQININDHENHFAACDRTTKTNAYRSQTGCTCRAREPSNYPMAPMPSNR